jgi:ribosomal-protein-alanine N-acetyltransferase
MTIDDIMEVVEGEKSIFGTSLGYDMLYSDLTLNPYAHYLILEINGKVKGYIGLWIDENAEIVNFYIDKKYQGMGFGSMVMEFVIQLCLMSKVKNISLEVRNSNENAKKLYIKFGFINSHLRKEYYSDGEDAIVMIRNFEVEK